MPSTLKQYDYVLGIRIGASVRVGAGGGYYGARDLERCAAARGKVDWVRCNAAMFAELMALDAGILARDGGSEFAVRRLDISTDE